MRILKIVGIILAVIIALYLVACFMGPTRVDASKSITIEAPVGLVYHTISDLKTWDAWSAWNQMDTAMKVTYGEITAGLGANYSWVDGKGETGQMEIIEADKHQRMKTRIQFGNFPGYSNGEWTLDGTKDTTRVTWHMTNDTDIPFLARAFLININSMIEEDFQKGLNNLKEFVEKKAEPPYVYRGHTIQMVETSPRKLAIHRDTIPFSEMKTYFARHFQNLMGAAIRARGELDGAPSGLYYEWDEENSVADMAAGIGVKSDIPLGMGDEMIELGAGQAAVIDYYGPYEGSGEAHYAMDDFFQEFGWELNSPVVEEYITDPMAEPDTSKWLTRITYRIK